MKTVIEMAREAGCDEMFAQKTLIGIHLKTHAFERFAELVRADERARMAEQPVAEDSSVAQTAEQPAQQEPVAWEPLTDSQIMASIGRHWGGEKTSISQSRPVGQQWEQICELVRCVIRERYTSLPAQREPVAYIDQHGALYGPEDIVCLSKANSLTALYTSPPAQRTWVGLTDEEWNEITWGNEMYDIIRMVESKLREKNT